MSCTSAAASSRSARSRWCSCAVSRQSVATPTVCSRSPPAYEWWPSSVAGSARIASRVSASSTRSTAARSPGCAMSATRNSRNPSSSSASRRIAGAIADGSTPSAGSSVRTSTWRTFRNFSTRPRTRTASPASKRPSRRSTSFQTRAEMRPLGSTSSSARYAAPFFVRSRSFFATAYTPSTVRFSSSCAIAVTGRSLGRGGAGTVRPMATIRPFKALRYDEDVAGPLASLVAPPYDVISETERAAYLARSPHNVVHLTLPDSEEQAARDLAAWRESGALVEDEEPSYWWLSQDYVGPDGVARSREGFVAALRAEPYAERVILPHERTHAGPKEGRRWLLKATRTLLEPIFLLWDGSITVDGLGEPDLAVEEIRDAQLLIADGHHRYETTLAFHQEDGSEESAWLMVVIVPTDQDGLTIFPTHRVAASVNGVHGTPIDRPGDDLPGLVLYRQGRYELLEGDGLDPEVVDE